MRRGGDYRHRSQSPRSAGTRSGVTGAALEEGRSGIGPIEGADRSKLRFQNGAEVHGYNTADYFEPKQADYIDRFAQFGGNRNARGDSRFRDSNGTTRIAKRRRS